MKRGLPNATLIAMALALPGCGSTDLAGQAPLSESKPLVLASPSLLPVAGTDAQPAADTPNADRLRALQRIVQDQARAMDTYRSVRDQQQGFYYTALTAIEEGLRLGTLTDNPDLLEHWQSAARASQHIDLALIQLQKAFATFSPAIKEAEALRAPFAATLRGQQDTALDELRRQKGLVEFESQKMEILRQAIAQGRVPPPPLQPAIAAENELPSPDKSTSKTDGLEPETPQSLSQKNIIAASIAVSPPLLIIRFNRPNIVFRAQLSDAVHRAKILNPEGRIHLVAVAPLRKTGQEQLLAQAESHQYAQSILRAAQTLGVPPENIRMTAQTSNTTAISEVHIYADE